MKRQTIDRILLGTSIGGFAILSISFMLMPYEELGILPGILFWGGLLLGVVLQIVLENRRGALFAQYNVKRETMQKAKNGLLSVCSNRLATVADGILAADAIATVLAFVFTRGTGYLCYVCLSVLVFSFCMHCILNGRIYIFVKNQDKVRQMLEQKKANTMEKGEGKK